MSTKSKEDIIELINLYLSEIDRCLCLLRHKYNSKDVLLGLKSKKIPRQGKISKNIEFQFHGVGCRLDFLDNKTVNFDFGYGGRSDGFSEGWLINFLENNAQDKFPRYLDHSVLKYDFEKLVRNGIIEKSKHPYDDLYYFVAK